MATTNGFVPSMPSPTEMMDTVAPNQYFASNHYNDQHANTNEPLPSFTANPFTPFAPTPNASIPHYTRLSRWSQTIARRDSYRR
jgi:hypothetical protein